ncbi:MAG: hypothetical protein ACD_79C00497G0003 [uncultured bacterium]|nr:MAG: hypothetical protein ACD_79C00497G0003 [uncultured bacterium]
MNKIALLLTNTENIINKQFKTNECNLNIQNYFNYLPFLPKYLSKSLAFSDLGMLQFQ